MPVANSAFSSPERPRPASAVHLSVLAVTISAISSGPLVQQLAEGEEDG
jgi:hypothetical protein